MFSKFKKYFVFVIPPVLFLILVIFGFIFSFKNKTEIITKSSASIISLKPKFFAEINKKEIELLLALKSEEIIKGLSGKKSLEENQGMLFVFEKPDRYGFWMKEMNFPIDIIWIDKNYKIIEITKNIKPDSYPKIFRPKKPAKFVLETNIGLADKNKIAPEMSLFFSKDAASAISSQSPF